MGGGRDVPWEGAEEGERDWAMVPSSAVRSAGLRKTKKEPMDVETRPLVTVTTGVWELWVSK